MLFSEFDQFVVSSFIVYCFIHIYIPWIRLAGFLWPRNIITYYWSFYVYLYTYKMYVFRFRFFMVSHQTHNNVMCWQNGTEHLYLV